MKTYSLVSGLVVAGMLAGAVHAVPEVKQANSTKKFIQVEQKTMSMGDSTPLVQKNEARPTKIVSVDSIRVLRESKEGKKLEAEIQKEVKSFEDYVYKANSELMTEQESLQKQSSILNKEALQEKAEQIMRLKKDKQREMESKRDELSESIQKRQVRLREKQIVEAREVLDKQGWELMVEKNAPFILAVSSSIDKTDDVLKVVNAKFDATGSGKSTKSKSESKSEEKTSDLSFA